MHNGSRIAIVSWPCSCVAERLAKELKSRYAEADVAERWYELGEKDRARGALR